MSSENTTDDVNEKAEEDNDYWKVKRFLEEDDCDDEPPAKKCKYSNTSNNNNNNGSSNNISSADMSFAHMNGMGNLEELIEMLSKNTSLTMLLLTSTIGII